MPLPVDGDLESDAFYPRSTAREYSASTRLFRTYADAHQADRSCASDSFAQSERDDDALLVVREPLEPLLRAPGDHIVPATGAPANAAWAVLGPEPGTRIGVLDDVAHGEHARVHGEFEVDADLEPLSVAVLDR